VYPQSIPVSFITEEEIEVLESYGLVMEEYLLDGEKVFDLYWEKFYLSIESLDLQNTETSREETSCFDVKDPWIAVFRNILVRFRKAGEPIKSFSLEGYYGHLGAWGLVVTEETGRKLLVGKWLKEVSEELERNATQEGLVL